ncbi:MAG: subclass B1 metallo-beta-lactamase, partial [Pseudomonadota bacterium]
IAFAPLLEGRIAAVVTLMRPTVNLEKLADGLWLHKSYEVIEPWGPVLSQGLVLKTDLGVTLVDTAWNNADTENLLDIIATKTGSKPTRAIVTHAHRDKMGGMDALHDASIETYAFTLTNKDAPARGLTPAQNSLDLPPPSSPSRMLFGDPAPGNSPITLMFEFYYPGPGHTHDNIVVYYAPEKILFGGCLIRPDDARNLGNIADGDVEHWAQAVRNVAAAFPEAEIIVPSHGAPGGRELLDHTIALAQAAAADAPR